MRTRRGLLSLISMPLVAGCSKSSNVSNTPQAEPESDSELNKNKEKTQSLQNIRDYGAKGDGITDDADAIQRAIDNANKGDTVYLPEPDAYYNVAVDSSPAALHIDGERHADNLTLRGDGPETKIQLADSPERSHAMLSVSSPNNFAFTLRDLVFDGNKRHVNDSNTPGHCVRFRETEPSGTGDILVEDVIVQNANSAGMSIQYGGVTVNRCTSRYNRTHGFVFSTNYSGEHEPRSIIKNSLSTDNTDISGFYALDCSGGKGIVEDCVLQNCENGTKVSVGGQHFTYRRVRIKNNDKVVMRNTGSEASTDVEFEDVVAEGNGGPWKMGNKGDYTVIDGSAILATNNGPAEIAQIHIGENATLDAGNAEVYSNRMEGAPGLASSTEAHGSFIANYYHYRNDRSATGETTNLQIYIQDERDKRDIPSVPAASDVGAWS